MPDAPRFSVTVPAYNAEDTLEETVASVRAQTFSDWELVICNDGSTDGTLALAERLAVTDPRIRVISQENRGSGGAYNTAVRASHSELLVMLSADDLLLPEHLATFDVFIRENPDVSVFTCDGFYEYEVGSRERAMPQKAWADPAGCTLEELFRACFFGVGAVYRRSVFDAVGGFREDMYAEDYLFWMLALARGFSHRHIADPLSVHRRGTAQKSARVLEMRQADARAVQIVMDSISLDARTLAEARTSLARLERTIRVRRVAYRLIGPRLAERLISGARRRHL